VAVASSAPKTEIGAQSQRAGFDGWSAFVDEAEFVPELAWPSSIPTYHRMRSDSQVEALHLGTTLAVREYRWSIDPNGASAALTEQAAADLGLPVRGHEEDNIARSASVFDFDDFLADVLLGPLYGHFHFEIVGDVNADLTEWHLSKLAPRHPRTIADFRTTSTGDLEAIRQNIGGAAGGWTRMPPPIPAEKLVTFVWRREAGSHVGRSMLRSLYREWLVKDRTIRVAAINLERAGGMPVVEGPQGASDAQLRDLAQLARQFKVAEGGGGAIPFGSKLHLVGGNTPDAIALLDYCDQAMGRVWALMLIALGTTKTGSRALGGEFADYAARTQRAMAGWIVAVVNRFLDRYTEWNAGPFAKYAPRLVFEQTKPDNMSTDELVALVTAGVLTVDPELESWLRGEHGLPSKPLGADGKPIVSAPRVPAPGPVVPEPASSASGPVTASGPAATIYAAAMLPDRQLRRQPYEHEVRAAVDFRSIDVAHETVVAGVRALYDTSVIPTQIDALASAIVNTKAGAPRTRLTRAGMAALSAPGAGRDDLAGHLTVAARSGANAAAAELAAQGLTGVSVPDDAALAALVGDQADAITAMAAHGISLAAQRKATSLVGGGRTPQSVADEVKAHLGGMKHQWTADQLQGAVTMAQNAGRLAVFASAQAAGAPLAYYASEILDANCCQPCSSIDGTDYATLADAEQDYPSGGFTDCDGGPRCRGTLVATYGEQNPLSESNPVLTAA
jgi:hypothetical protein